MSPPRACRSPTRRCSTPLPGPAPSASKPCRAAPPRRSLSNNDREALAALRRNIEALGEIARARIVPGDATRPPRAAAACAVAFLDPPYGSGLAGPALAALAAAGWLTPTALVVIETAARETVAPLPGFTLLDQRVYGAARLVFLRREPR